MKILMMIFVLFVSQATAFNCVKNNSDGRHEVLAANTDKIVYRFVDASIPPQYHRSYTIIVKKLQAKIDVDSYGKILRQSTVKISRKQFDEISSIVRRSNISRRAKEKDSGGCTGGTEEILTLFTGRTLTFKAGVYHCGSDDYGDLEGSVEAIKTKLKSLFPKISKTLK